jgi:molybdenum cofactor sulfurtransferase
MVQALSYYKIFGYPSGLGALLVRRGASQILRRKYFGGGTVLACSAETDFVRQGSVDNLSAP